MPSLPADGIHGFGRVQLLFCLYLALTFGTTIGLRWLGLPSKFVLPALLAVGLVLLKPFWPRFREHHPEHDET